MNRRIKRSDITTEEYLLQQISGYLPVAVDVEGESGLLMVDNHGRAMPKKIFLEFMKRAILAYETEGVEEWIRFHNFKQEFPAFKTIKVSGKHILPTPYHFYHQTFRKDIKKDWSFRCKWCDEKVSSKTDEDYVRLKAQLDELGITTVEGTFCQKACAENYWYESVIQIVMENKVTDFIHIDKRIGKESN